MPDPAFRTRITVRFGDIDNAGIVYYPRFLHYFHVAIEDFFSQELGVDFADVLRERGVSLPTVHIEADFRRRLRYGDRIDMEVRVLRIGRSSIRWGYAGYRDAHEPAGSHATADGEETLVVEGNNVTVCVETGTFEKVPVPGWLRDCLADYSARIGDADPARA